MKLYNQEDYFKITKKKNAHLFFIFLLAFLFVATLIVFILISSFKTKTLFSVLSSIIELAIAVFLIFFIDKYFYLKRLHNEYLYLLNNKNHIVKCEVLACSDFLTTLPDKSRCYEVMVKVEDKQSIYYLSEIFNRDETKEGTCELLICSDYIVGVKYGN